MIILFINMFIYVCYRQAAARLKRLHIYMEGKVLATHHHGHRIAGKLLLLVILICKNNFIKKIVYKNSFKIQIKIQYEKCNQDKSIHNFFIYSNDCITWKQ